MRLTHPLPHKYWIAVSGGVDSMSVLHWLNVDKPDRKDALLGVLHINHNTGDFADNAEKMVRAFCKRNGFRCTVSLVTGEPPPGQSREEWWRNERYDYFDNRVVGDDPIILGHHFDDCLEEYIMCTMVRGFQGTIPYSHGRCIRPFRLWKRKDICDYARKNAVSYVNDPSNLNTAFKRNYIRSNIVPSVLSINPGVYNIVEKMIRKQDER